MEDKNGQQDNLSNHNNIYLSFMRWWRGSSSSNGNSSNTGSGYGNYNNAPEITNTNANVSASENQTSAFTVTASDSDGDALNFQYLGKIQIYLQLVIHQNSNISYSARL